MRPASGRLIPNLALLREWAAQQFFNMARKNPRSAAKADPEIKEKKSRGGKKSEIEQPTEAAPASVLFRKKDSKAKAEAKPVVEEIKPGRGRASRGGDSKGRWVQRPDASESAYRHAGTDQPVVQRALSRPGAGLQRFIHGVANPSCGLRLLGGWWQ